METTRWSGVAERRVSDGQWQKCSGNVVSQPHFLQWGTGVEQQMKLPTADKAHVPDSDAHVVCGGGFPRGCKIQNPQTSSVKTEKRPSTIVPHSGGIVNPFPCREPQTSERAVTCKRRVEGVKDSLLVQLPRWSMLACHREARGCRVKSASTSWYMSAPPVAALVCNV